MVDCKSSNKTCNKVKSEFEKAGQEIAKTIKLNTPIYVNVYFIIFANLQNLKKIVIRKLV